jgi:hypothetical protein
MIQFIVICIWLILAVSSYYMVKHREMKIYPVWTGAYSIETALICLFFAPWCLILEVVFFRDHNGDIR